MTRRAFTVLPIAHAKITCARCGRKLREGEQAVVITTPGMAETRHAGRACPPAPNHNHDHARRVIQGA